MPWAIIFRGLLATIFESNCLKLPAAAFLGFANFFSASFSFNSLKEESAI